MNYTSLVIIVVFSLIIAGVVKLFINASKKNKAIRVAMDNLKLNRKGQQLFLCYSAEEVSKNIIQLWGEPFGASVKPGMILGDQYGKEYIVKEVYDDDGTPEKSDEEVLEGTTDTPIIIETTNWDWENFKQSLKREGGVVAFNLK